MGEKYDFSGWATRNDLTCSDGRIIRQDAFKDCDGATVPLVWMHSHDDPDNVLGHCLLENRPEGVYTYGFFNDTERALNAKEQVRHKDIDSLSIWANHLKQSGNSDGSVNVVHGDIKEVNPSILYDLLEKDYLPIVCPIGLDDEFNSYNINADDAACAIAKAVKAEKLAFLTDIEGVYKDPDDKSSLISELTVEQSKELIESGYIGGGMLPKLNNCIDAVENGVSRVHILDGRIPHSLLLEIFTKNGVGTQFLANGQND